MVTSGVHADSIVVEADVVLREEFVHEVIFWVLEVVEVHRWYLRSGRSGVSLFKDHHFPFPHLAQPPCDHGSSETSSDYDEINLILKHPGIIAMISHQRVTLARNYNNFCV